MKKLLVGIMVAVMVISIFMVGRASWVKSVSNEEIVGRYLANTYHAIVWDVRVNDVRGDEVHYTAKSEDLVTRDVTTWKCYTSRDKMEWLLFTDKI